MLVGRRLVHFGERGGRRIGSGIEAHDRAGEAEDGAPDGTVRRRGDRIEGGAEPLVLRGIDRLVRLHVVVAPAIAVRIHDERGPAL